MASDRPAGATKRLFDGMNKEEIIEIDDSDTSEVSMDLLPPLAATTAAEAGTVAPATPVSSAAPAEGAASASSFGPLLATAADFAAVLEQFGTTILNTITFSLDAVTSGQASLENKFVIQFGNLNISLDTLNNGA